MSGESVHERRSRAAVLTAVGVGASAAAVGGWLLVAGAASHVAANRWVAVAGAVLAGQVGYLAADADLATDVDAPANLVTLCRGTLYAATAGFLAVSPSTPVVQWAPAACYGAGAALDFVDGRLARWTGRITPLGERLDHAFDTLGFLVAPLVGVAWGRLPALYLSLSAARYVYRAGLWWRRRRGRPVGDLPESRLRRPLAAVQMAVIAVALAPVLPASVVHPAALVAVAPSLAVFLRDYLVVTGRLSNR